MPQWSARQVLSITKNTIYKGYLTYNKSHIDDFLSHKSIKNSEQDYILVKGSFEPIISEELWDKCQRRRHAWQSYKDGNIRRLTCMERANTPTNGLAACFVAAEPECGRSAQRKALFDISVISGR